MKPETVYVVGVGPGDPELLTLRAARVLRECHTILHAGPRDDSGFAVEVAAEHFPREPVVRGMALSMRKGADGDAVGYGRVVEALIAESRAGRRAAFLSEGDPMLFGTGSYVAKMLQSEAPDIPLEIVPGVTALSAAAARLGWPLAQKDQILTVCPGTYHADDMGAILDRPGPSCWLKAASILPRLLEELGARGRLQGAALLERVGRPDERVFLDLTQAVDQELSYFSIVLVR